MRRSAQSAKRTQGPALTCCLESGSLCNAPARFSRYAQMIRKNLPFVAVTAFLLGMACCHLTRRLWKNPLLPADLGLVGDGIDCEENGKAGTSVISSSRSALSHAATLVKEELGTPEHQTSPTSAGPAGKHAPSSLITLDSQFESMGDGPCLGVNGNKPAHRNCKEADVASAYLKCQSACLALHKRSRGSCLGFQVCEKHACVGLCVVFVSEDAALVSKTPPLDKCTWVPGIFSAIDHININTGEEMWKCFKYSDSPSMGKVQSMQPSSLRPSVEMNHATLPPSKQAPDYETWNNTADGVESPLVNEIRMAVRGASELISFHGKYVPPLYLVSS